MLLQGSKYSALYDRKRASKIACQVHGLDGDRSLIGDDTSVFISHITLGHVSLIHWQFKPRVIWIWNHISQHMSQLGRNIISHVTRGLNCRTSEPLHQRNPLQSSNICPDSRTATMYAGRVLSLGVDVNQTHGCSKADLWWTRSRRPSVLGGDELGQLLTMFLLKLSRFSVTNLKIPCNFLSLSTFNLSLWQFLREATKIFCFWYKTDWGAGCDMWDEKRMKGNWSHVYTRNPQCRLFWLWGWLHGRETDDYIESWMGR
jgi:hypothetical protein